MINSQPRTIHDLETPSVLINLEQVEANIADMQNRCDALGISFRPHIKTHKIPDLAQMQLKEGAVGIACQKVSEAEIFADAGFDDIQIPYNIVGERKTARLAALARRVKVSVLADSLPVVEGLAHAAQQAGVTIDVLVDVVSTNRRTGTTPQGALELAEHIVAKDNLHFQGVLIYPSYAEVRPALQTTLTLLKAAGIPVEVVSGGGVGASLQMDQVPELTEMRVGTYIFNDWRTVSMGWATLDQCAMTVMATVVSANEADRVILDSGSKTLAADRMDDGHGHILEYPNATIYQLNEEHAFVDCSRSDTMPRVGDTVHVIPVHTCVVTNLHNQIFGVRGEEIDVIWDVMARGRVW